LELEFIDDTTGYYPEPRSRDSPSAHDAHDAAA
jgi:hypothetical protein